MIVDKSCQDNGVIISKALIFLSKTTSLGYASIIILHIYVNLQENLELWQC